MKRGLTFIFLALAFSGTTLTACVDNSTPETGVVDKIADNDTEYGLQLQNHLKSDRENLWPSRWVKAVPGCKVESHYHIDSDGNPTCKQ